jgi:hypothetical protein
MIDTQLFHDVLLVMAVLIGLTTALSAVMLIAPSVSKPGSSGRPPRGGLRRDLPRKPQPEPEPQPQLLPDAEEDRDRERELVLV